MGNMLASYFAGKKAVITGAGDGIGRALAQQLNGVGCELWLCDINPDRLDATRASLDLSKAAAHPHIVDCGNQEAIVNWGRVVAADTHSVDAVFNNAGVAYAAPFTDASEESFQWLMAINFWGVVWSTRAFLPLLQAAPVGHLVNISSIFGMIGVAGQSAYNSAKFAVRGFTEALQAEYRNSSIKVSCVHPGGVATNIARRARADGDWALNTADERDAQFRQVAKTTPEKAATIILRQSAASTPRIFVGWDARIMHWLTKVFPTSYHYFIERLGQNSESK